MENGSCFPWAANHMVIDDCCFSKLAHLCLIDKGSFLYRSLSPPPPHLSPPILLFHSTHRARGRVAKVTALCVIPRLSASLSAFQYWDICMSPGVTHKRWLVPFILIPRASVTAIYTEVADEKNEYIASLFTGQECLMWDLFLLLLFPIIIRL
jgi:hypothetical protein